jgi:C-terminal processing protease CtpA/Prc
VGPEVKDIQMGDAVVRYDGKTSKQLHAELVTHVSAATPQYLDASSLWLLSSGPVGSKVALELEGQDGKRRTVDLAFAERGEMPVPKRPEVVAELEPGIVYVDLGRITTSELDATVPRLEQAKGIVFDLRGYPGKVRPTWMGLLTDVPISCAQWLVPVVSRPDHESMQFVESNWLVQPRKPRLTGKIVILTDGRAISYAETTLGIIEHYHLATIVGGPTAGTNGNINPFTTPSGQNVSWTGMKVLKHDGARHHGVGIRPDIRVAPTLAGIRAGRDEVLERGLQAAKTGH